MKFDRQKELEMNVETLATPVAQSVEIKTLAQAIVVIVELQSRVEELEKKTAAPAKTDGREMTDDDARRILFGDLADKKHKDAGAALGLSYGQIYSCRLGFTFKSIHKEMKEAGKKNPWMK